MPAFATHYIFAKEMIPLLKKTACFALNEESVYFGAQGPDIFFFHRVFPWMPGKSLRKIGSAVHRAKPAEIIDAMAEYLKISANSSIAESYIYGFILHYALDRNCHPYVYALQDKIVKQIPGTNPHTAHNKIELAMDSLMLHNHLGIKNPLSFHMDKTIGKSKRIIAEIAKLYVFVIDAVLNQTVSCLQIETVLKDFRYVQNILFDKMQIKRMIIAPLEMIAAPFTNNFKLTAMLKPKDLEKAKKYANIDKTNWKSPYSSKIQNESFEELFELSKQDAHHMISDFGNGCSGLQITNNLSFLTGVEME